MVLTPDGTPRDPDFSRLHGLCRDRGIRRLSLFGSRLKGTHRPDSDMDLLVEFEPGKVPGLIGLSALELDLSRLLGHQIDLRTPEDLSHLFRQEVMREARTLYAR